MNDGSKNSIDGRTKSVGQNDNTVLTDKKYMTESSSSRFGNIR